MYAEMPEEEKEAWNARAEADKHRYLHELSNYVPPPGFDSKGELQHPHMIHPVGVKPRKGVGMGPAVRTERDPSAPRKNMRWESDNVSFSLLYYELWTWC